MLIPFLLFVHLSASPDLIWPDSDWRRDLPRNRGFNERLFEDLLSYSFSERLPNRSGIRTDSLVVVKDGRLIFERYEDGYSPGQRHAVWSISKSVMGLLIGVAEKQKKVQRKDLVSKYIELKDKQGSQMTVEHLLQWTSGIRWQETYEFAPLFSDVVAMLYSVGFRDMAKYVADRPFDGKSGTLWNYSSGDSVLLSKVFQKTTGEDPQFAWTQFFSKLGIRSAVFERDLSNNLVGASGLFIAPDDLARIGYLILKEGVWKKDKLLPDDWVSWMKNPSHAFVENKMFRNKNESYGAGQIWINYLGPNQKAPLRWPDAPPDTMIAMGHWGQYLIIIPSYQLVVVRMGDDRDSGAFDKNYFLSLLIKSLKDDS